jgi:hypothetical protein
MFYLFNHPGAKVSQQQFLIPSIFNMNRPVKPTSGQPLPVKQLDQKQIEKKKLIY